MLVAKFLRKRGEMSGLLGLGQSSGNERSVRLNLGWGWSGPWSRRDLVVVGVSESGQRQEQQNDGCWPGNPSRSWQGLSPRSWALELQP